ncbi:MAG: transglutaminase domain-containing protein [Clostridium sp.]|mgnify:FL=1|nr:transglutaminase domain-containing protein [Clostridium sp.]
MKISLKTGVSAGVMLALAASLITITDYTVKHEQIRIQTTETAVMSNAPMEEIGNEITARIEAEEISAVIAKLDTVSLSSYNEIQEARQLYENASGDARSYINEQGLLDAESAYAQLEQDRTAKLTGAIAGGDVMQVLEYADTQIQGSGDVCLDSLVQEFIGKAVTDDMSRSEQLQACYDYMVANYSYGYNYNCNYGSGRKSVAWATAFLRDGYGACNNWSAAFTYIARALGYDCRLYYGSTAASRGGSVEHYWPCIVVEGTEFIFDPQVEGDMTRRSGVNRHNRFGLTGTAASAKYYFSNTIE